MINLQMKTREELSEDILNGIYDDYKLPMLTEEQNATGILGLLMDKPELIRNDDEQTIIDKDE